MARQTGGRASSAYEEGRDAASVALRLVVIVSCLSAVVATSRGLWAQSAPAEPALEPAPSSPPPPTQSANDVPPTEQSPTPSPRPLQPADPSHVPPHVGIVAGHWGNDNGATCPDGLTEVEINLDVAQRVVYILQALGYEADLLAEFDPRMDGYQADAIVSIHADSCEAFPNATPPASGFKVASVEDSLVPQAEEQLVSCLAQCYAARTGMYFHANSITYDMTRYHTFYEIHDQTPGAIIETGFMMNDRRLLTERADLVAQGIVDGIVCFIEGETP